LKKATKITLIVVALLIMSLIRDKKAGKSPCGGNCAKCGACAGCAGCSGCAHPQH
jgi:hypothetical protein